MDDGCAGPMLGSSRGGFEYRGLDEAARRRLVETVRAAGGDYEAADLYGPEQLGTAAHATP